MDEDRKSAAMQAIDAYLANYEPDPTGTILKTTDAILRELDDMVEIETNDLAEVLAARGFQIHYVGCSTRHGWAMRLKPQQ